MSVDPKAPIDDYIGEPGSPAPWTTKRPLEGLRDTEAARIVCTAPDVCLTPVGSSVVPIPYQVHDLCGHDENYTPSVRFTGQKAMVMRSKTSHCHGDAPGTKKGVVSGTVEDVSEPVGHAAKVRAEGSEVIRHLDRFKMNNGNTVGEAIFVRDTKTYDPPTDDDPVRGSLRLSAPLDEAFGEPIVLAYAGDPADFMRPPQAETTPSTRRGGTLERTGTYGQSQTRTPSSAAAARVLGILGLAAAGWEAGDQLGQWYVGPENVMGLAIEQHLRGQIGYGSPFEADLPWRFGRNRGIEAANDLLSVKAGRAVDFREMSPEALEELLERPWPTEEDQQPEQEPEDEPQPVPPPPVGSNVRVDEDHDRRCPILPIPFTSKGDRDEFERQIEEQEDRLNRMTVEEYQNRRALIRPGVPGRSGVLAQRRRDSLPFQDQARQRYIRENRNDYIAEYGRAAWNRHLSSLAATHELDLIAGGYHNEISGMGGASENSSIGPQWRADSRSGALDRHAEELERRGCPMIRVNLYVV